MNADALVIGGGPAGSAAAVWLAIAGWKVVLAEQQPFPRQKVCGECLPAAAFTLLDELGVGQSVRRLAGPELRRVGWMDGERTLASDMPTCDADAGAYGRAIGRDVLDALLLARARAVGVEVLQPARVMRVRGTAGNYQCELAVASCGAGAGRGMPEQIRASIVIDAHGSWQRGPRCDVSGAAPDPADQPTRASDLLAFKATFTRSALAPGLLPVIALPGGYGGMVVSNDGRTTVALCLRRDALHSLRLRQRGAPAGIAVERYLRECCPGADSALRGAERAGAWLAVGPLRPGRRAPPPPGIHRVGNAAAESHPLVGEGIRMALHSARLLAADLAAHQRGRASTAPRLAIAACYAHIAMRPRLAAPVGRMLQHWPTLLTAAAVLAGKSRPAPSV